jgi:glycosyltransferase involved in cell wall biosynthesis
VPLFSICIPCFNHAKYVGKTIESVLAQDFEDFEIVVADNASTDGSPDVVTSFGDPRVRLVRNRYNIGFAPNLQQVTRHAQGRYVNLLSSDDLMSPGALSTYAEAIRSHRGGKPLLLMSQTWIIDSEGDRTGYTTHQREHLAPLPVRIPTGAEIDAQPLLRVYQGREVLSRAMRAFDTVGSFATVTYDRVLWEAVEGYNAIQHINPDMHFVLKVLGQDPRVVYVYRPLYAYRVHAGGQLGQQAAERSVKFQLDMYNWTLSMPEAWLKAAGVDRDHLRRMFVDRDCVGHARTALAQGSWRDAARLLSLAMAFYPEITLRSPEARKLAAVLAAGPPAAKVAKAWRDRRGPSADPELRDVSYGIPEAS